MFNQENTAKPKSKIKLGLVVVLITLTALIGYGSFLKYKDVQCENEREAVFDPEFRLLYSNWSFSKGCTFAVIYHGFETINLPPEKAKVFIEKLRVSDQKYK